MPVPEPNPVALARAQQELERDDDRSILAKMFGMFSRRPPGSSETGAASSPDQADSPDGEGGGGTGTFSIDPRVVQPDTQKPR
jgi:hypothetical protein